MNKTLKKSDLKPCEYKIFKAQAYTTHEACMTKNNYSTLCTKYDRYAESAGEVTRRDTQVRKIDKDIMISMLS